MTYVRDMKSIELIEHMRKLQKMPGWSDPLADSLFRELEDLELRRSSLWNACSEWAAKTDWARPFEPKELGKHICDVIKDRFGQLASDLKYTQKALDDAMTALDVLKESNEALRKDAERYRWLRDQPSCYMHTEGWQIRRHWKDQNNAGRPHGMNTICLSGESLDQCVDAAIYEAKAQ